MDRGKWTVLAMAVFALVSRAAQPSSVGMTFDNDFLYSPRNDDWNYTGGIAVEWAGPRVGELSLTVPTRLLDDLVFGWSGALEKFPDEQHTLVVGGTSYTPHGITNAAPIPDDRPYASLVFLAGRIRRTDDARSPTVGLTTEFTIGVLGLGLAEEVQSHLHSLTPSERDELPRGWRHQISDGGELTLEYRVAVDRLVLRKSTDQTHDWFQASVGVEAAAGYNTYGWAGGLLKLGRMSTDYGAPGSIIGPLAGRATDSAVRGTLLREWYLFARGGGYAVAYNALLQGQTRHSEVTVTSSRVERFVDEFQYGLVLRSSHVSFVYSLTRRSAEFEGDLAAEQYFGSATLTWALDF